MQYLRQQKGFLLVEVIFAIVILGVTLLAISGLFSRSSRAISSAGDYTFAINLAQEQMELYKVKDDAFWKSSRTIVNLTVENPTVTDANTNITYRVFAECKKPENIEDTVKGRVAQLVVTINWNEPNVGGGTRACEVKLTNLFFYKET